MKIFGAQDEHSVNLAELDNGAGSVSLPVGTGSPREFWTSFRDKAIPFDNGRAAEEGKVYRVKVEWDKATQTFRVWVDGVAQRYNGHEVFSLLAERSGSNPFALRKGIDTISLHCGLSKRWVQKMDPKMTPGTITWWRNFKVYELPEC